MKSPLYLVTAASGRIGSRVAGALLASGERVRVVARDGSHLSSLVDKGAEPAVGDLRDAAFAARAFAGVDRAFLLVRADRTARDFRREFGDVGLFRIAHNRAIDFLRRYEHRMREAIPDEAPDAGAIDPDDELDSRMAARAGLWLFTELPPSQRACVILKDVLAHSSREVADTLELSVPAVEACLHRGRARLKQLAARGARDVPADPRSTPVVERYAALFDARDWNGLRSLLAEDVRLDLVGHSKRAGVAVGKYFTNYAGLPPHRAVAGWFEGREGMFVHVDRDDATPAYFVELRVEHGLVASIRDYRFVPYLLADPRHCPINGLGAADRYR